MVRKVKTERRQIVLGGKVVAYKRVTSLASPTVKDVSKAVDKALGGSRRRKKG